MNPLGFNATFNRTYSTYSKRFTLYEGRKLDQPVLSLRKTDNLSRNVENQRKSSHRGIVSSHLTIQHYWRNEDYENIINFIKAVIEEDLDQNLSDIGQDFLKGSDLKEKLFWCRKYDILNDFTYKTLEKFIVEGVRNKSEGTGGLSSTFNKSLTAKLSQNSGLGSLSRTKVQLIIADKNDAEYSIRLLIDYFIFQQTRNSNCHLFEPSVSELKQLVRERDDF